MQLVTISKGFPNADAALQGAHLEPAGGQAFGNHGSVASYSGSAIASGGVLLPADAADADDARELLNALPLPVA